MTDRDRPQAGQPSTATDAPAGMSISHRRHAIRTGGPAWRWECPCQEPPVLLATYDPNGRINIKVRDRYWHLTGFGMVQAICPRCAAEHVLDLARIAAALDRAATSPGP